MEINVSALHKIMNASGQGHFQDCLPLHQCVGHLHKLCLKQFLCNSLVQVSGESLQDQWSSGFWFCVAIFDLKCKGYTWRMLTAYCIWKSFLKYD